MLRYKHCVVPKCNSTTAVTPKKQFFQVPRNAESRTKWSKAMNRDDKPPLSVKSALYCCEDHFDVETDTEINPRFKANTSLGFAPTRLKKGVIPHKFACQKKEEVTLLLELSAYQRHKQVQNFKRALNSNISSENLLEVAVEFVKCEPDDLSTDTYEEDPIGEDNIPKNESNGSPSHRSIGIQVNLKKPVRSQATNTDNSPTKKKAKRSYNRKS